ncbi:caspase domain-containing protein [Desarmillaria tabescens]|uniref:Caspase domain-containing protein n=1 Tax=Armillaria tabescens TaxID=1929756 RepID=A0AA39JMH2_ARMTA|nr:caspase domain-containing protein [Desarmillaria tabescens]KAK0444585.1 caspase domain-containing protein [Desarmillaria tabescens]
MSSDPIDPVEVRERAREKAKGGDTNSCSDFDALHNLYHSRKEYAERMPRPPKLHAPLLPIQSLHVDASRFWAVIIGIDGYPSHNKLLGCVSDAIKMGTFLYEDLGVPKDRIECLIDGTHTLEFCSKTYHPSRANILMTLFGLIDNPEIQKDENIIIYFAGHGAAYRAEGIDGVEAIEALCPIDRGSRDADGMLIADISDRQINTILTQISRAKGRRITLILDCCHAGSITRAPPGGRVRASRPLQDSDVSLQDMLVAADAELMSKHFPGYRSILSKEWFPDMDSHVALAACEAFQIAIEVKGQGKETGGYFTTHLLAALRSGCLTRETTYRGLLEFIPVSDRQTPVVAGTQMDALLWFQ